MKFNLNLMMILVFALTILAGTAYLVTAHEWNPAWMIIGIAYLGFMEYKE